MNNVLQELKACDTPYEVWDMLDEVINYIETLEAQNQTLAGILDDLQGGEA